MENLDRSAAGELVRSDEEGTSPPRASYDLGILFVHGIGGQRQGDTLITWGDAVAAWLIDWAKKSDPSFKVLLTTARIRGGDGEPARAVIEIISDGSTVRWLFSECWWANDLAVPSFGKLASWSIQAVPTTLLSHVLGGIRRAVFHLKKAQRFGRVPVLARLALATLIGIPLTLLLAPAVVVLLVVLLVLGLIPLAAVRSVVTRIQRGLTGSVGDSLILLESPTQGAAMTSRVADGIRHMRDEGCRKVAVVAHSQGAAIVHRSLAETAPQTPIDALVTVGSGITKLHELKERQRDNVSPWLPSALLLATAALGFQLRADLRSGVVELQGLGIFLATLALLGLLIAGTQTLIRRFESRVREVLLWVVLLVVMGGFIAGMVLVGSWLFRAYLMFVLPLLGGSYLYNRLSSGETRVDPDLRSRVARWLDLYAYCDPVPNGRTVTSDRRASSDGESEEAPPWPDSVEVHNLDSILRDHSTYAAARDDSLARVVEVLLDTSGGALRLTPPEVLLLRKASVHRCWRVRWLRRTRWVMLVASAIFAARNWNDLPAIGTRSHQLLAEWLVSLPSWIASPLTGQAAFAAGVVVICLLGIVLYSVAAGVWRIWNQKEMRQMFERSEPDDRPETLKVLLAVWGLSLLAAFQADSWAASIARFDRSRFSLGEFLEGLGILAFMLYLYSGRLLLWLVDRSPLSRRRLKARVSAV